MSWAHGSTCAERQCRHSSQPVAHLEVGRSGTKKLLWSQKRSELSHVSSSLSNSPEAPAPNRGWGWKGSSELPSQLHSGTQLYRKEPPKLLLSKDSDHPSAIFPYLDDRQEVLWCGSLLWTQPQLAPAEAWWLLQLSCAFRALSCFLGLRWCSKLSYSVTWWARRVL